MQSIKQPIKQWAEDDRPREKLILKGRQSLSNAELLAILIGSGTKEISAVDLSKQMLSTVNDNLAELAKLSLNDLCKFRGIGSAKAVSIIAALELGRRRRESEVEKRKSVTSSQSAYELILPLLADQPYEMFALLLLNRANNLIRKEIISNGGISGTVVDPRRVFKIALENNASGIILCHNHPSGNLKPSEGDIAITKKLIEATKHLDITILDHLIIGEENYFSFADEGMI